METADNRGAIEEEEGPQGPYLESSYLVLDRPSSAYSSTAPIDTQRAQLSWAHRTQAEQARGGD